MTPIFPIISEKQPGTNKNNNTSKRALSFTYRKKVYEKVMLWFEYVAGTSESLID